MAPPRKYDHDAITDEIFDIIAHSDRSLWEVCKTSDKFPSPQEVTRWIANEPQIHEKYARAKECQADFMAAQIRQIADECRMGIKTIEKQKLGSDEIITETTTGDMVERSRLMIDARKWLASKLAPKKYGDKQTISGDPDNPLTIQHKRDLTEEELIAIASRGSKGNP